MKNRDLSWLGFNHRVLQEAADPAVPLYERIKFLAIWSSNLDEFFRVRVASLRALARLKKKTKRKLDVEPERLLKRLLKVVWLQQEESGEIFKKRIKKDLAKEGIFLVRENELSKKQKEMVISHFHTTVLPKLSPVFLSAEKAPPFLHNRTLYLVVRLRRKSEEPKKQPEQYALVEIPTAIVPRFFSIEGGEHHHYILFLDDVVRLGLDDVFPQHFVSGAYAVKLTRDAELELGDEYSGDLLEKIKKALGKRSEGVPARFLYDTEMPKKLLLFLQRMFELADDDLIPGSRYHNFSDFFSFPNPKAPSLLYEPMPPLPVFDNEDSIFRVMQERDTIIHFPYHSYDSVVRFLSEAADDESVRSIKITLYRVARNSKVVGHLLRAANNGKSVTVFVEVKARFDEESNIFWAEELEKAGARVLYSIPNLKVHAKLCLVTREESDGTRRYAYFSTGNFNEAAATQYTDFGFFTSDKRLTNEAEKIFQVLHRGKNNVACEHLLVSPFSMRTGFEALIGREIKHAKKGREARIAAKMNSLEDPGMIERLYEASNAGVQVRLIVRGICCLIPGIKGMSENIEVTSIVDRFLEHTRVFLFHNNGNQQVYLSSADWMRRNLDRRIEVAFPIYDKQIQHRLKEILDMQLCDNVKARIIDKKVSNRIRSAQDGITVRSQSAAYELWRDSFPRP
ncbi:MAG: polyphosphate kinase 1 [Bacteroidetes bacterium]|nr:polyphosphate kinase 1 [Bacteroidota bacterium]MCW5895437.1 polyphosphate kinase 1 [Bacteroidota bacterium]